MKREKNAFIIVNTAAKLYVYGLSAAVAHHLCRTSQFAVAIRLINLQQSVMYVGDFI
jgi:hypothetical protein